MIGHQHKKQYIIPTREVYNKTFLAQINEFINTKTNEEKEKIKKLEEFRQKEKEKYNALHNRIKAKRNVK
jgi:hypothetical protein